MADANNRPSSATPGGRARPRSGNELVAYDNQAQSRFESAQMTPSASKKRRRDATDEEPPRTLTTAKHIKFSPFKLLSQSNITSPSGTPIKREDMNASPTPHRQQSASELRNNPVIASYSADDHRSHLIRHTAPSPLAAAAAVAHALYNKPAQVDSGSERRELEQWLRTQCQTWKFESDFELCLEQLLPGMSYYRGDVDCKALSKPQEPTSNEDIQRQVLYHMELEEWRRIQKENDCAVAALIGVLPKTVVRTLRRIATDPLSPKILFATVQEAISQSATDE